MVGQSVEEAMSTFVLQNSALHKKKHFTDSYLNVHSWEWKGKTEKSLCYLWYFRMQQAFHLLQVVSSLLQILDLQDRLQDQVLVRRTLEKALNCKPFSHDIMTDKSIPKVKFLVVNP